MNRKGETWFYGSLEPETAVIEKYRTSERRHLSVGPFRTTRSLTVLDLTARSLEEPSIFDLDRQRGRIGVRFLQAFAAEIALPVRRPDSPRYVPTQLVTAYVRSELAAVTGSSAQGILFPSSRTDGANIVLFAGAEACVDQGGVSGPQTLVALDPGRARVLSPAETLRVRRSGRW